MTRRNAARKTLAVMSRRLSDAMLDASNKAKAFERCTSTALFKAWCQRKLDEIETGQSPEQWVEDQMRPENLRVETRNLKGQWAPE